MLAFYYLIKNSIVYTPTQQKIDVFHIALQDENRAEIKCQIKPT